jgi:hypothetical protein
MPKLEVQSLLFLLSALEKEEDWKKRAQTLNKQTLTLT